MSHYYQSLKCVRTGFCSAQADCVPYTSAGECCIISSALSVSACRVFVFTTYRAHRQIRRKAAKRPPLLHEWQTPTPTHCYNEKQTDGLFSQSLDLVRYSEELVFVLLPVCPSPPPLLSICFFLPLSLARPLALRICVRKPRTHSEWNVSLPFGFGNRICARSQFTLIEKLHSICQHLSWSASPLHPALFSVNGASVFGTPAKIASSSG